MQQHEEEGKTEPGPKVLLPGSRSARALHQRPRLSDRLVRVRKDNCQGNPSNYDIDCKFIVPTIRRDGKWRLKKRGAAAGGNFSAFTVRGG